MKTPSLLTIAASAVLITSASATVTMDWVTVSSAGNAADPLTGYGTVGYEYKIGKYEVTNAQYAEFLNAKAATDTHELYDSQMSRYGITRSGSSGSYTYAVSSGMGNRPVVFISWFDAARFSNWMANGQGDGDTETGSYNLNGASSGMILPNADAKVRLPSEDEWYKAAYYNAATSTYSIYPNGQNSITTANANYNANYGSRDSTDVGTYVGDQSMFGTFDQGGNVWEWNDAVMGPSRGRRGGSYVSSISHLSSSHRFYGDLRGSAGYNYGFRLASVP
jgi:sulfatase modifying factor 1